MRTDVDTTTDMDNTALGEEDALRCARVRCVGTYERTERTETYGQSLQQGSPLFLPDRVYAYLRRADHAWNTSKILKYLLSNTWIFAMRGFRRLIPLCIFCERGSGIQNRELRSLVGSHGWMNGRRRTTGRRSRLPDGKIALHPGAIQGYEGIKFCSVA